MRIASVLPIIVLAAPLAAQVPASDIYLAELRIRGGRVSLGTPVNVTRRAGYDNQPSFLPDGRSFLYTAIHEDGQADIYRYDIGRGASTRVTTTAESEYSPTPLPEGRGFSVVRVEADSTQRLWVFELDGRNPRLMLERVPRVGYHAWADRYRLGLFVLGSPPTLQLADTRSGAADTAARDIGRSIHAVPHRDAISFVQKDSSGWTIAEIDLRTRAVRRLVRTLGQNDFFVWTPDGIALMAQGSKLFQWNPRRSTEWEEIADFAAAGLTSITRLAVSPRRDRLAIVALPPQP